MPLWGKRSGQENESSPALGMGPDYAAPEISSPADTYSPPVIFSTPRLSVPEQWEVYNVGRDQRPPETERIDRSRREEEYLYNGAGLPSDNEGKDSGVRPSSVYWEPPRNNRQVNRPSTVAFTKTPFGHGYEPVLNGEHFSMASNIRTYEIYGQGPNYVRRINTLRAAPAPMDINTWDAGPETVPAYGVHESTSVNAPYSRSFRL